MTKVTENLIKQRRFQKLLLGLVILAFLLGLLIVPVEKAGNRPQIITYFDGIWWAVTTITSVGYGDMVPVTVWGKLIGMTLQVTGVLAFGLMVSLVTVSLDETKERFYRNRLEEKLDKMEAHLEAIEKKENFVVRNTVENGD